MSTGIPIHEKACTKCGETKPLDQFGKEAKGKWGLMSRCKACMLAAGAKWRAENPEKLRAQRAAWLVNNREEVNARAARWRAENPEKTRAAAAKWRAENPEDRSKARARKAKWAAKNPDNKRAHCAKRHAAKIQRTPPWADYGKIAAVYAEQQRYLELGIEVHVDHIVPLQCALASGLHTHDNLRIILAADNHRKNNKMPEDPMSIEPTGRTLENL